MYKNFTNGLGERVAKATPKQSPDTVICKIGDCHVTARNDILCVIFAFIDMCFWFLVFNF